MSETVVYFPATKGPLAGEWRRWLFDRNMVDPRHVVRETPVWVTGDEFTVIEFARDERGTRIYHTHDCDCEYGSGGHVAKRRATYKIRVPLGEWAGLGDEEIRPEPSYADPIPKTKPVIKIEGDSTQAVRAFDHAAFTEAFVRGGPKDRPRPPRRPEPPDAGVGAAV